jgi:CBS domain-containing protein
MTDKQLVRVRQVMKTNFDTVDGMATVREALETMRHVETKCLIVNKRHDDDEYGMLLISDIARKVLAIDRAPDRVNVYEIMAKPVITVHEDMDIRYCARLLDRFEISRAPVVNDGHVVGIISLTDMVLKGLCNKL